MLLRAAIQGAFSATEGLEVEGRASDSDDWTRIELLEGWAYSDFYVSGGTVTDAAGDTQTFSQVGGWIDFAVTIPDAYTQVRIHTLAISGGNFYEHDIALWRIELLDGATGPPPVPTGLAASVTAISDSGTTTTVTWNASSGATKYQLLVFDQATEAYHSLSATITATTYAYTDTALPGTYHGRAFSFLVRAGNDDGQWSEYTAITDAADIVIPMASPTVQAVGDDSISVAWTAPLLSPAASARVTYDIRYRETGTANWATLSDQASGVEIDGLDPDTLYEAQVRIDYEVTEYPASAWSASGTATTAAEPGTPVTPTAAPIVAPDVLDQPPIVAPIDAYAELGGRLQATVNAFPAYSAGRRGVGGDRGGGAFARSAVAAGADPASCADNGAAGGDGVERICTPGGG